MVHYLDGRQKERQEGRGRDTKKPESQAEDRQAGGQPCRQAGAAFCWTGCPGPAPAGGPLRCARTHRLRPQRCKAGIEAGKVEQGDHGEGLPVGRAQRAQQQPSLASQARRHRLLCHTAGLGCYMV